MLTSAAGGRLPLALEIAAARMNRPSGGRILAGLDRRFELLRCVTERDTPAAGARGTPRLSVRLLSSGDDGAASLALLTGDFDLETAANAVANGDVGAESVPELIWSLVDRSLLVADPIAGATNTFAGDGPDVCAGPVERHGRSRRAPAACGLLCERLGPGDVPTDLVTTLPPTSTPSR